METCDTFADVLSLLELESYWPCKISLRHVFEANLNKTLELKDIKWHLLNKIISVDLRARDDVLSDVLEIINNQVKPTDTNTKLNQPQENEYKRKQRRQQKVSLFHPQDVLNAIYLCCSPFLKQVIVSKLLMCRIAVPVIGPSREPTAGFFWPFDFVATEGTKSTGKCIEGFLSDQDIQIVSFIRLHRTSFSKSDFLNNVLSTDPFFRTFYSRNCPLGTNSKRTLEGTIEASHFVPFGKKKSENFDDVILFLNLRGDAQRYPLLVNVIKSVSNVVVVLLQTMKLQNDDKALEVLSSIYNTSTSIIIALESSSDSINYDEEEEELIEKLEATAKNANCEFNCVELKANGNYRGMDEIVKETRSDILRCLANTKYIRLSTFSSVVEQSGITCDFALKECTEGCQRAEKLFCMIDAKSTAVQQLWIKLSQLKKKKYKEKVLQTKRDIEKQIHQIRTEQHNYISNLPKMSLAMLQHLYDLRDFPDRLMFFLKHLKLLLDKRSKKILPDLLTMFNDLSIGSKKEGSKNDQLELQIKKIKIEIEEASFGVEHLMREVAQIYEALTYASDTEWCNFNVLKYVENCPSIAANLLIDGYPLEVMDGAASDVPLVWIKQVLSCLESKIGSTAKLLTLSIMGIQSSGKSTLLNAMFGLQLAVSTGRCTKGIFLQLIPMPKDQFPFQYVLVFDTEGLRSNEYRESMVTHAHDNQLATFVVGIGDITLINIRGENMSEVSDILEIVVHAFIRMKKVNENFKLKQSCIFVYQDVADANAKRNLLPGTLQFVKCLDEITNEAAEQEHLANCHSFDRIIHFNHEKHVFYFPNLWRGTPPLCAINTEYSESVDRLRKFIISDISERRKTYFSVQEICSKVGDLWEAILSEDFIFSFRNGIELKAERAAESKFLELHRKLENTVSQFLLIDAESAFRNCENEEKLVKVKLELKDILSEKLSTSFENLQKEWTDFIEDTPLRDIIIQWKESRLNQLERHKTELELSALKEINMTESSIRLDIRQRIILTPKEMEDWKYHANNIVEKCTDHPLDNDIIAAFEKLWSADLRRFSTEAHEETISIDDEIWKIVLQYFQNDKLYLMNELKSFKRQQRVEGFEQTRQLKGCINEMDITERHLSGKRFDDERKIALTMADDIFSEIDIFVSDRENKRFNIVEIREIFDNFLKTYEKCDVEARKHNLSLLKDFKAMLAVYIWKYLGSVYQRIYDEYEKTSGLHTKQINYKATLLNNFRKLISEAMKLKMEKKGERKQKELEFQIKRKEEHQKQKQLDLKLQEKKQEREEQQRKLLEEERKIKKLEKELKDKQRQRQVKMQEEREREQDRTTALSIKNIIDECIILHVSKCLQEEVITEILQRFAYSKINLIKFLMVSLAEREDFDDFNSYIHSTISYVKTFIQTFTDNKLFTGENLYLKLAERQIHLLINNTKDVVRAVGNNCLSDMATWSKHICQKLHFINIPNSSSVRYINVSNFNNLTSLIIDHLETSKNFCISHFRMVSSYSVNWNGRDPYQPIFEKLWGCEERCPFCFEPCEKTQKKHCLPHSCLQHRPDGVSGWRWKTRQILSLDTCDANVASENVFFCNENRLSCQEDRHHDKHEFRNYNTFDPSWKIHPDNNLSASKYWSWYICRFKDQIKSRYDVKYPSLPDDWKNITKHEAIQSLG